MNCKVLFFSMKVFEKNAFENVLNSSVRLNTSIEIMPTFLEVGLDSNTVNLSKGFSAVSIFVTDKIDKQILQQLKLNGVELIALRSAGFNHVDIKEAERLNIKLVRVPAYSPEAIAEFCVGIYLSLNRKIHRAHQRVREGNFSLNGLVGHNVRSQTIGIVGTGKIGKCVAQIFRGFGAKVCATDPFPDQDWAKDNKIEYVELEYLLKISDVVSLHLPLTAASYHLMDESKFGLMKNNSYFINTSRGGLVEAKALIKILKSKKLAGAALDVYEEEEGVFFQDHSEDLISDDILSRLTTFPNVLITSHQAFLTQEALDQIAITTIGNIQFWAENKTLINEVKI